MILEMSSHDSLEIISSSWKQKGSECCWWPSKRGMLYNFHHWSENHFRTEKAAYATRVSLHSSYLQGYPVLYTCWNNSATEIGRINISSQRNSHQTPNGSLWQCLRVPSVSIALSIVVENWYAVLFLGSFSFAFAFVKKGPNWKPSRWNPLDFGRSVQTVLGCSSPSLDPQLNSAAAHTCRVC